MYLVETSTKRKQYIPCLRKIHLLPHRCQRQGVQRLSCDLVSGWVCLSQENRLSMYFRLGPFLRLLLLFSFLQASLRLPYQEPRPLVKVKLPLLPMAHSRSHRLLHQIAHLTLTNLSLFLVHRLKGCPRFPLEQRRQ
jgi:hypothetical protein